MILSVLTSLRALFAPTAAPSARTAKLALDACEDRTVPASVSFTDGVVFVAADAVTNDIVKITALGASKDGSTGVKVVTNVEGTLKTYKFTGPVTNVALDMKDGNDFVDVAPLRSAIVLVGAGNGNNYIEVGDSLAGGVIVGSGQNDVSVGNSTYPNAFSSSNLPGGAGAVAFVGWGYNITADGKGIFLNGNTGNANNNTVRLRTDVGYRAFVDIVGTGNNTVLTGAGDDSISIIGGGSNSVHTRAGNDLVRIQGAGNNHVGTGLGDDAVEIIGNGSNLVHAGQGNDTVNVFGDGSNWLRGGLGDDVITVGGNGNNSVHTGHGNNTTTVTGSGDNSLWTRGTGSITVNGGGKNAVRGRYSPGVTISLNGAGPDSSVVASLASGVFVDGAPVTASGVVGNVKVKLV